MCFGTTWALIARILQRLDPHRLKCVLSHPSEFMFVSSFQEEQQNCLCLLQFLGSSLRANHWNRICCFVQFFLLLGGGGAVRNKLPKLFTCHLFLFFPFMLHKFEERMRRHFATNMRASHFLYKSCGSEMCHLFSRLRNTASQIDIYLSFPVFTSAHSTLLVEKGSGDQCNNFIGERGTSKQKLECWAASTAGCGNWNHQHTKFWNLTSIWKAGQLKAARNTENTRHISTSSTRSYILSIPSDWFRKHPFQGHSSFSLRSTGPLVRSSNLPLEDSDIFAVIRSWLFHLFVKVAVCQEN